MTRSVSGTQLATWAIVALGLLPAQFVAGDAGDRFSDDELARLERGELLQRRSTIERDGLRLMGGTSWQVIDAAPSSVWRALLDTGHYSKMLPQVTEARVVRESGDDRTLYLQHGNAVAHTSYYLDLHVDRDKHRITFSVDATRPRSIRAGFGVYTVRPYRDGRSLLVYGVMADIGDGPLRALLRPTVHEWMMKVPWMVKRFVEGSGRDLYSRVDPLQAAVSP